MMERPWVKSYPPGVNPDPELDISMVDEILTRAAKTWPNNAGARLHGPAASPTPNSTRSSTARPRAFRRSASSRACMSGSICPTARNSRSPFSACCARAATIVNYSPLDAAKTLEHKLADSETDILVTLDLAALYPQMSGRRRALDGRQASRHRRSRRILRRARADARPSDRGQATRRSRARRAPCHLRAPARQRRRLRGLCRSRDPDRGDRRAAIYRRHDRQAEGRDADARQFHRRDSRMYRGDAPHRAAADRPARRGRSSCCRCSTSTRWSSLMLFGVPPRRRTRAARALRRRTRR